MFNKHAEVIVFDIGGTWFRSGVITKSGKLEFVKRCPAFNYMSFPDYSVSQLQDAFVGYLINETQRIQQELSQEKLQLVSISMGAALNAHTGLLLNSGPLWGPKCLPFDLLSILQEQEPSIKWIVVNDITAALLRHISELDVHSISKVMLITISTGIGCRIYDRRLDRIPVDRSHGLQGEIGHIPITFEYKGRSIELFCDCGGFNHLNAFCSGRGIEKLLQILTYSWQQEFKSSILSKFNNHPECLTFIDFAEAVRHKDEFALSILDAVTFPLAKIIHHLLVFDPEVESIILTGGVVHTLGRMYLNSLLNHLEKIGLYQVTERDPSFFRRRICPGIQDDNSGLVGAAIAARRMLDKRLC